MGIVEASSNFQEAVAVMITSHILKNGLASCIFLDHGNIECL